MFEHNVGRGEVATADMKARIAALKAQGAGPDTIFQTLWRRNRRAVIDGEGYEYEYADRSE